MTHMARRIAGSIGDCHVYRGKPRYFTPAEHSIHRNAQKLNAQAYNTGGIVLFNCEL